jgi:hypothetical protein
MNSWEMVMKNGLGMVFGLLLLGCAAKPDNKEIEQQVRAHVLRDGVHEFLEIRNFQKTNGFERDGRTYEADVRYDIRFTKDLQDMAKSVSPLSAFQLMSLRLKYGAFSSGQTVTKTEKMTFIRTEQGWRLEAPKD